MICILYIIQVCNGMWFQGYCSTPIYVLTVNETFCVLKANNRAELEIGIDIQHLGLQGVVQFALRGN